MSDNTELDALEAELVHGRAMGDLAEVRAQRIESLNEQLSAAQAVISELDEWFNSLGALPVPDGERIARLFDESPTDALQAHDRQVAAKAWDEGNAVSNSGLPRCPACDDRPVSMHRRGDLSEWRHDDDGTVICGGSFTEAVHVDLNPYRAASLVPGNPEPTEGEKP